jgi:hypothetical protein
VLFRIAEGGSRRRLAGAVRPAENRLPERDGLQARGGVSAPLSECGWTAEAREGGEQDDDT